MQPDTSLAVKAAVNLSEKQCSDLYHNRPFEVTKEIKTDICKFCVNYNKCCSDQIEEQFLFLLSNGKGRALANFRNAAGGYPYIEEFLDKIKSKPKTNQKEPL